MLAIGRGGYSVLRKGRVSLAGQAYLVTTTTKSRIAYFGDFHVASTLCRTLHERGLFEFSQLAPGTGLIELDHPDYAPGQRSLKVARAPGAAPVELTLVAGWSLALSVRARGSGDPIAGARVEVDERLWSSDEAGEAEVRRLAEGLPEMLDGFRLVSFRHRRTTSRREVKAGLFVAEASFRAVME